jgi:hypothetical protein
VFSILTVMLNLLFLGKDQQMAAIVARHGHVADLCHHAGICTTLRQSVNTVDETEAEVTARTTTVTLAGTKVPAMVHGKTSFCFGTDSANRIFRRKIRVNEPAMVFPVLVGDSMRIPLINKTVPMGANARVQVTLPLHGCRFPC